MGITSTCFNLDGYCPVKRNYPLYVTMVEGVHYWKISIREQDRGISHVISRRYWCCKCLTHGRKEFIGHIRKCNNRLTSSFKFRPMRWLIPIQVFLTLVIWSYNNASNSDTFLECKCLFIWHSYMEMVDCFENLFVEVNPEKPYPKNNSGDDENFLDVNFWFHCRILFYCIENFRQ